LSHFVKKGVVLSHIIAFTDGASSGNPGPGGWGALIFLDENSVIELGGGESLTTNNKMEMQAAIEVLQYLSENHPDSCSASVEIHTDSQYLIKGITSWVKGWKRNGWKTQAQREVLNRNYWEELDQLASKFSRLKWEKIAAHAGLPGNERADEIAVAYSQRRAISLYHGPASDYYFTLESAFQQNGLLTESSPSSASPSDGKYPKYLSFIDRELQTHLTWGECEGRVKGRSGARFKKVKNSAEEAEILEKWGIGNF
jgi:ribonuclease HI